MSGHNKWSKIKHKKAATDAKKSKIFSILAKQITLKSKEASGDVSSPALRAIMEKAKRSSMPKENIDRAVKKGVGGEANNLQEVTYETYGPGGVGIIIEGITDNTNRTNSEVKHLLTKSGFELATPGSVTWAFEKTRDEEGNFVWKANNNIALGDSDAGALADLIEKLEELDDVDNIYTNAD